MTVHAAKTRLTVVWLAAVAPLMLILIMRQLHGFYDTPGTDAKDVWSWVSQFVLPGITLILGAWTVSATPSDQNPVGNATVFWAAVGMSAFYLIVLYLVVASQGTSAAPWPETFKQSALYLGVIQGAVIAVVGKFFIESAK